jgi:hypothetical protein
VEAARARLVEAEASAVLADAGVDVKPVRRRWLSLRDEVELGDAGVAGLQAWHQEAVAARTAAIQAVAAVHVNWARAEAARFIDAIYQPELQRFVETLRLAAAVGAGLGSHRLTSNIRGTSLCDAAIRRPIRPTRAAWSGRNTRPPAACTRP